MERLSDDLVRYGHRNEMLSGAVNQTCVRVFLRVCAVRWRCWWLRMKRDGIHVDGMGPRGEL